MDNRIRQPIVKTVVYEILFNRSVTGFQGDSISIATGQLSKKGKKVALSFAGGNDGGGTRASGSVTVEGSNDGNTWTTIGTLSGFSISQGQIAYASGEYEGEYLYYRTGGYSPNFVTKSLSLVVIG